MVKGILVLLDALGTKVPEDKLKEKVRNFDLVDDKFKNNIEILQKNLNYLRYNDLIYSGTIYDNFQIFLESDIQAASYVDMTGKNDWYWSLILIGELLIDIFRYALSCKIPLRGCITSGIGEISKTKRILGPIADEASKYYEITNWIGIIVTNHPTIVLNNKVSVNPNREIFEPYIKYNVPIKQRPSKCSQLEYRLENMWTLRWPVHRGYNKRNGDGVFYAIPDNNRIRRYCSR